MVGTKVLVTGGAGFLGIHLVRALLEAGATVRVLDDFSSGAHERLAKLPVEVVAGDVRDPEATRRAVAGAALVFHLAGRALAVEAEPAELLAAEEVNVGGALVLLHAAQRQRARTILAGSGAVYGRTGGYVLHEDLMPRPQTPRAVQHLAVEHHARLLRERHGVEVVVLRLFRCFGPDERWDDGAPPELPLVPQLCRAALGHAPPRIVGDGRQTRDFVYVDNAVAALLAAGHSRLGAGATVYNVASGEAVSVLSVWAELARAAQLVEPPPVEYLPERPWEPPHFRVSIARARRDLGYAPTVPLREGLQRCLVHYQQLWERWSERRGQGRAHGTDGEHGWFAPREAGRERRPPPPPPPLRDAPSTPGLRPLPRRADEPSHKPGGRTDDALDEPNELDGPDDLVELIEAVEIEEDEAERRSPPASATGG